MMNFGVAGIATSFDYKGKRLFPGELQKASRDAESLDQLSEDITCNVEKWRLHVQYNSAMDHTFEYDNMEDFLNGCSTNGLRYVFVFDGARFFAAMDHARLFAYPDRWEEITNERDEYGYYKGRNKEAYMERSGPNGERYSVSFWTYGKLYNTRHVRLRPTEFVNLDNIFTAGRAATCRAFGEVDDLDGIHRLLIQFNDELAEHGVYFIHSDGKFICGETIGAIAKNALLRHVGKDRIQKACPLTPELYNEFFEAKLMRGEINFLWDKSGEVAEGRPLEVDDLFGYDVNSEFLRVAATMWEIGRLEKSSMKEYENDESGKTQYIIIFDDLRIELRKGEIPVYRPAGGDPVENGIIATKEAPLAFFHQEIEEMQEYYAITSMHAKKVYKADTSTNAGYYDFAQEWYTVKRENDNNPAKRTTAKMIINAATGKLAQRKVYGKTVHRAENGSVVTVTEAASDEQEAKETGALAFIQGAFVYAMARVYWMQMAHKLFAGYKLADVFVYGDTDSFYATVPADARYIGPKLGQVKCECKFGHGKFLARKCYAFAGKDTYGVHIAGTPKADYYNAAFEALEHIPTPRELVDFLAFDREIYTTVNIRVNGGRADVQRKRKISKSVSFDSTGRSFGTGKATFWEV